MKVVAIIEARMTSSRLPGKVMMKYVGISNLEHIINRLKKAKNVDEVIVATTINESDSPIIEVCRDLNIKSFRGSEDDVLSRVLDTAKYVQADIIVEITGDCPLVDPCVVDEIISVYKRSKFDYVSNILNRTYPRGYDVQVFKTDVLQKVSDLTSSPVDREHVSLYIYTHPEIFTLHNVALKDNLDYSNYAITLDTYQDYKLISDIYDELYGENPYFGIREVINLLENNSEIKLRAIEKSKKNPFKEQEEWLMQNE